MKIEYKFVDGTVTEIEVDGSLGEFMLEMKNEGDRVESEGGVGGEVPLRTHGGSEGIAE